MTNRNTFRGNLILVLAVLVALVGFQPGLAESQDIEQLRQAAEQGDAEAQNALGRAYDEGRGVAEDDREAVKWYRRLPSRDTSNPNSTWAGHTLGAMGCGRITGR